MPVEIRLLVLMLCVSSALWASSQEPAPPPAPTTDVADEEVESEEPPPPPDRRFASEIEFAERLGAMIYVKSRLMREAEKALAAVVDQSEGERGSVVVSREGQWLVRFVGSVGQKLMSFHDVRFSAEGVPSVTTNGSPEDLSREESQMFLAKQSARVEALDDCGGRHRAVTLPSPSGRGWAVYLLREISSTDAVPVGGHFRASVSRDGKTLFGIEPLDEGCRELALAELVEVDAAEPVWIMHSPYASPAELHVFLSLHHEVPLRVGTWAGGWLVEDGGIEFSYEWGEGEAAKVQ